MIPEDAFISPDEPMITDAFRDALISPLGKSDWTLRSRVAALMECTGSSGASNEGSISSVPSSILASHDS